MAIHNKSHSNHALMSLIKMRKDNNMKQKTASDFEKPAKIRILHCIMDCCDSLKTLPDESVQLICIDPPYNLELTGWDVYENYIEWAAKSPSDIHQGKSGKHSYRSNGIFLSSVPC